jgi:glycosyltransferase involved in cell wall biosynthesis
MTKRQKASITVITPALPQRTHMLAEAVESLRAQTLQPARHLVAFDYGNVGPGRLMNQLVDAADTEWVAILPDDDLYDPDHLATHAQHFHDGSIILSWSRIDGRDQQQYRGTFDPRMLAARQDTGMRGVFTFKKNVWRMLGGFRESMEDWDFLNRAVGEGIRMYPVYRETWTYRFHGGPADEDTNTSTILAAVDAGENVATVHHLANVGVVA